MEDMNNVRHQYGVLQNGEGSGGSEYGVYQNGDPVNGRTEYDEIRSRTPGSIFGKATADAHERADNWLAFIREQAQNTPDAYRDLMAIRDKENYDKANKRLQMRDTLESAIASTPDGEAMSQGMINYLNDKRGIASDGKNIQNGQIMQGGWNPRTGGFGFVMASVDDNGNVRYEPREMARNEIYGMMRSRPELFDASRTDALGQAIQKADTSYYAPGRLDGLANQYKVGRDRLMNDVRNAKDAMGAGYYGGVGGRSRVGGLRGGRTVEDEMKLIEARKNAPRFDKNYYDALVSARNEIMYKPDGAGGYNYNEKNELDENQKKELAAINARISEMLVGGVGTTQSTVGAGGTAQGEGASTLQSDADADAKKELARRAQGGAGATGTNGANASAANQNVIRPTMGPIKANAQRQKPKPVTQQERLDAALPYGYATTTKAADQANANDRSKVLKIARGTRQYAEAEGQAESARRRVNLRGEDRYELNKQEEISRASKELNRIDKEEVSNKKKIEDLFSRFTENQIEEMKNAWIAKKAAEYQTGKLYNANVDEYGERAAANMAKQAAVDFFDTHGGYSLLVDDMSKLNDVLEKGKQADTSN